MAKFVLLNEQSKVVQVQDDHNIEHVRRVLLGLVARGYAAELTKPDEVEYATTLVGCTWNPTSKTFHRS